MATTARLKRRENLLHGKERRTEQIAHAAVNSPEARPFIKADRGVQERSRAEKKAGHPETLGPGFDLPEQK